MGGSGHGRRDTRRILVVCTRYIGDTVLAIPFLRNLRRAFPTARIDVCAEGAARTVLADCPYIDELVAWRRPVGRRGLAVALGAIRAQAAWLRDRGYDRAYLLKRSLSGSLLAMLAGIPRRVGFAGDGRMLLTTAVTPPRGRHQADRYLDLLRAEGFPVDDGHNENWVAPGVARRVAAVLERLPTGRPRVFVAPRSTAEGKHWPIDRWAAVVEWLVLGQGCEVVLCGGADDAVTHDRLKAAAGVEVAAHVHDLTWELSLLETSGLLARMDACIGVDTGLVHLAASHGLPVAVLFGPTDPNRWSPWTPRAVVVRGRPPRPSPLARLLPRRHRQPLAWPEGPAAMDEIAVEDVVAAVATLLPEAAAIPEFRGQAPIRTLDLCQGSFRYEVLAGDPSVPPAAAAEPATKPLAQAH